MLSRPGFCPEPHSADLLAGLCGHFLVERWEDNLDKERKRGERRTKMVVNRHRLLTDTVSYLKIYQNAVVVDPSS